MENSVVLNSETGQQTVKQQMKNGNRAIATKATYKILNVAAKKSGYTGISNSSNKATDIKSYKKLENLRGIYTLYPPKSRNMSRAR